MSNDTATTGTTGVPEEIRAFHDQLTAWRRDFHAHPEIGFEEKRTSALVADRLASFGCEVHRQIGGTGVVGVLRNGDGGDSVGLRADMDALPIAEENTFDHRSANPGTMHACGHDGHTTMLLGAARYLAEKRNFRGTVHFIFQPAEEGLGGARAMIDQGLFERFPCRSVYAMHNWPGLPGDRFGIRPGAMLAGGGFFDIDIRGRGSHGAFPHLSADPVIAASELVLALQTIVSRRINPTQPAVVSVTRMQAGDAYNVIPESIRLGGTARGFSDAVLEQIETEMRRIAASVATGHQAEATVSFRRIFAPTINAERETTLFADVAAALVGEDNVDRACDIILGSEDFSFMTEVCPGAFILLGNGESSAPLHTPAFDFNDAILPLGAALFAGIVEKELG